VNGYNVYRSTISGSNYTKLNALLLSSSNYIDNSVANGTTYYYVVTAVDMSSNESNYSSEVSATPTEISSITIQENTTGFCSVDGTIDDDNSGFTGTGYANTNNATGNGVDWKINIQSSITYTFTWRYANSSSDRPAMLLVNGSEEVSSISFPSTGVWTSWSEVSVDVNLSTGIKDIRLEATSNSGLANIDYLMVTGPAPQAASCL
jgi:fibronectin type 3 domain-containing protein